MATHNGTEYAGPGWSVPPELWPAAVTRRRRPWRSHPGGREMEVHYKQMTEDKARPLIDGDGRITFRFAVGLYELACASDDGSIEGLNQIADDMMPPGLILGDINYRPVEIDGDLIVIEVDADVTDCE